MNNSMYVDLKNIIKYIYKHRFIYAMFLLCFLFTIIILKYNNQLILKKVYIQINIEKLPFFTQVSNPVSRIKEKQSYEKFLKFEDHALNFFRLENSPMIILAKLRKKESFNKILFYEIKKNTHYLEFLAETTFNKSDLEDLIKNYSEIYNESYKNYIKVYLTNSKNKITFIPAKIEKNNVIYKKEYYIDYKSILLIFVFFLFNATIVCIVKELIHENNK